MIDSKQKIQDLEAQIDILNASLNDSQYLSDIGSWNWNVITDQVTWSDNMFRILGLEPNELVPSYELALNHIHDSDKEKYEETLNAAIDTKSFYFLENKITKKDNSVIFAISRGNCVFNVNGDLIRMYGTVQDVTSQKHLEEFTKEKIKTEEAKRVRLMFLSIISHELKHPLLILKNFSKLIVDSIQRGDNKKTNEYAEIINNTSNDTFIVINNLLEWTRANSSELTYNPELIYFKKLLNKIIQPLSTTYNKKNISIKISENSNSDVYADKNVLNILFKHLIENALKFTNANGQIIISLSSTRNGPEFSVADNGVGIEPKFQKGMFNMQNIYSTAGTNGELGTGIGLKLCKNLVEKHNGTFRIKSEIGKGTECIFSLPNP